MPDAENPEDLLAWFKLRDVYREFRANRIDRAEGESRKRSIFKKRAEEASRREQHFVVQKRIADFFKDIEIPASAYMKDRTLENADTLIETIYGSKGIIKRKERENAETKSDNSSGD